jgi:starch synthase
MDGVEYYGDVSFLKGGLQLATAITTVSPTYAQEIRTPEFGMGLDGLINARASTFAWYCQRHRYRCLGSCNDGLMIAANYSLAKLKKRQINRSALAELFRT